MKNGDRTLSLNGSWRLLFEQSTRAPAETLAEAVNRGYEEVSATVPGNVELDLERAGLLEDLYDADNLRAAWELEGGDWWFVRTFEVDDLWQLDDDNVLQFDGIDTVFDVWVNGDHVGSGANMLVPHNFPLSGLTRGTNEIVVHIHSAVAAAAARARDYAPLDDLHEGRFEGAWLRKAPSTFGWDIAPRVVSAGMWRDVSILSRPSVRLDDIYLHTKQVASDGQAILDLFTTLVGWLPGDSLTLQIKGISRETGASFVHESPVSFAAERREIFVDSAELWWPRGYGDAVLYDVELRLLQDGRTLDEHSLVTGIRTVEVVRRSHRSRWAADENARGEEDFRILVNGVEVFLTGTNWVPVDGVHSRDLDRLPEALDLLEDVGGNIVRCWGGNVYEHDLFFERCDEVGILVWQDFALACGIYPQTDEFADIIAAEARAIVRRLRNHPSLFLWVGNNENDQFWVRAGIDPNNDRIARQVLRDVVLRHDPYRSYMASSPFYSSESFESKRALAEEHLWGARAGYKTPFFANHGAAFISEIGYHGLPATATLRRFLPIDRLTPDPADPLWLFHSTLHTPSAYKRKYNRIQLLIDQASLLFPSSDKDDRALTRASQITQAEAFKFFVESARTNPNQHGVIWWNLLDGWPQISDAVVDYYFRRKLAYYFLRNSQSPVQVMAGEATGWRRPIVAHNATRVDAALHVRVSDLASGEELWGGDALVAAGSRSTICSLPVLAGGVRCLLLEWHRHDGLRGVNHYIDATADLDLADYDEWLRLLAPRYGIPVDEAWAE